MKLSQSATKQPQSQISPDASSLPLQAQIELLNEKVARYRGVIDAALDAVIVISPRGIVEYYNPAAETLFGYSSEEVIGNNISKLMPSPDREQHDGYLARYISTRRRRIVGTEREVLARRKDGSLFPIELAVTEVTIEGKQSFAGSIRDVSQRRKEEASLRILDSIVSSPDDAIFVKTIEGKALEWNKGAELLYGYSAEEIVGCSANNLIPLDRMEEYEETLQRLLKDGNVERLETIRFHKDGHEINVSLTISPVRDLNGKIGAILVSSRDISKLRESEQDLLQAKRYAERLIHTANAMIVILDAQGNVQLFNPAAERITSYRAAEMLGKNWFDTLLPTKDRAEARRIHLANIAGDLKEEYQTPIKTKSGKIRIISWRNSPIDQNDKIIGVLSFGIDITKQGEHEAMLRKAHDELEAGIKERTSELSIANQILEKEIRDRQRAEEMIASSLNEKDVFLKEIHHRVKNNLQLVISILNLHIHEMGEDENTDTLAEIRDRIFAIAHLHETLYQSGNLTHVNIEDYLRGLVSNLVHSSTEIEDIDVTFTVEPVPLNLDETLRCGLIVNELVLNALKHAFLGRNRGRISISLSRKSDHGPLTITVTDDGIGLPPKLKLEESRSIGFHLVEKLTEKLGGEVRYSNTPGACIEVSFLPEES